MLDNAKLLLKKYFGYESFRDGQEKVIESILNGFDTFAIMPTGAGKSICFQIPSLLFPGVTLVISPLISLMKDQVDSLNNIGIPASFINSTLSNNETMERINSAADGEYKLLYIAPERLESEQFKQLVKRLDISMVAVDEAHCVSQWGHNFRPSYLYIPTFINELTIRPIVTAFTATATEEVKEDVIRLLTLKESNVYVTGFDRENLTFNVIKGENKRNYVLKYMEDNKDSSGIIYASTRKEVDGLYEVLNKKGFSVGKYHAGLSDDDRRKTQEDFIYDDIKVMVATNAFGMGIDKSNVRYVIHYNIPKNMEAYYQEAGRAGRDGLKSECILLFSNQDIMIQKFLIDQNASTPERKVFENIKLRFIIDYCHTERCLRKYILEYFGEKNVKDECGNCGNCNDDSKLNDITIEAQKIFSCILRMRERFGTILVAEVLKGSKNKKVLSFNFDSLSTYGIMKEYTLDEIKDMINLLVAEEYIGMTESEFPVLKLKQRGGNVLSGKEKVLQKIAKRKPKIVSLDDNSLFDILRNLRKEISTRENVPPYIIFADIALKEMCEYMPIDKMSMLSIKGVGEKKFERYGEEFIGAIKDYGDKYGIELKVNNSTEKVEKTESKKSKNIDDIPSYIVTYNMYKEGLSLGQISKKRALKALTIQDHLIKSALEGNKIDWDIFIPSEYEEMILSKIKEIGASKLKPIKDELPGEIDYMAIKAVICKYNAI